MGSVGMGTVGMGPTGIRSGWTTEGSTHEGGAGTEPDGAREAKPPKVASDRRRLMMKHRSLGTTASAVAADFDDFDDLADC